MTRQRPRLGRNVLALTAVSFFTDVSSEMIYPLLPVFLTTTLGASAAMLGVIEGAAETTASLLKLASGWWSDRVARRKPLIVTGYVLSSVARPLLAAAQAASQVLAIRLTDRVGKGIRGAPRDALIADSVAPDERGRAFGFHRAGDHAGAVFGPLIAFGLLQWAGVGMRAVFWLAAIPAAAAVLVVLLAVRDRPSAVAPSPLTPQAPAAPVAPAALPRRFWHYLAAILLFTLGNSTDAFLLVRAEQLGVSIALIPVLWAALHVVKSAASTAGGTVSDRVGRPPAIITGWLLYAAVYAGFALATAAWHAWALFGMYGLVFALTEGPERAFIADLVAPSRRGTAYGFFNLTVGLAALPASLLFGLLWDRFGPATAFLTGGGFALVAAAALLVVTRDAAPLAGQPPAGVR